MIAAFGGARLAVTTEKGLTESNARFVFVSEVSLGPYKRSWGIRHKILRTFHDFSLDATFALSAIDIDVIKIMR